MIQQPWHFQLTVDSEDPHELAHWWAESLGWVVEPQDEAFIQSMVDQGRAQESDVRSFRGKRVWRTGAAINHPDGSRPRVLFQEVPELKTTKNRVHWDLRKPDGTADPADVDRLVGLGARRVGDGSQGPSSWVVLEDPEGNEFCV